MATNPEEERQRLAERYASLTVEQLREIASESAELTDIARATLQAEIQRRGPLVADSSPEEITLAEPTPDNSVESFGPKPVMIRSFRDLPEALLAKGSLDSAGIESFLADENMVRMDWFWSNLIGGVKLVVNPEDAADAIAVLDQPTPESFEVPDSGEYHQPHCPQCSSLDVSFEELNKPIAYASAYLNLPLPIHNQGWNCRACGHRWNGPSEEVRPLNRSG